MLELRRLRLLRELHARGTIAAVADALSYSPSTVSHQLAELQREAGVPLFERDGRRLRLTEAAHVLVRHADALLRRMDRAEAEMAAAAGVVAGTVRVAAFQTAAVSLVAPALADLAARHPALRVEVTEAEAEEAFDALLRRECDLAVCDEYGARPRARPRGFAAPDFRHRATDLLVLLALVARGGAVTLLPELSRPSREPAVAVLDAGIARRVLTVVRDDALARPALAAVRSALRDAALDLVPG